MIYGYARTSTAKQKHDNTIKVQVRALKKYLQNHHETVNHHIYKDSGVSGKTMNRPALNDLINNCLKPDDTLVIYKLDRLGRSFLGTLQLIKNLTDKDIRIVVLTPYTMQISNSPQGKLIRHILMSVADFERDLIIDRMNSGRMYKKAYAKKHHLSSKAWKGGRPTWLEKDSTRKYYFKIYDNFKKYTGKQMQTLYQRPPRTLYYAKEQVSKYLKLKKQTN